MPYGVARCPACQEAWDGERERRARERAREASARSRRADPERRAFYRSKEWRALSARALARAGFRCEDCGRPACEMHHDPPLSTPEGWARRLDASALHCLCTRCHNVRHGRFGGAAPGVAKKV